MQLIPQKEHDNFLLSVVEGQHYCLYTGDDLADSVNVGERVMRLCLCS